MLTFDQYGFLLPYTSVLSDLDTLEQVFVNEFSEQTTRRAIYERYKAFNAELLELLPEGFTQWIDGSFVSRKSNPEDIDFVVFIDAATFNARELDIERIREPYRKEQPLLVDAYFVRVYPEGHRLYSHYHSDRVEWLNDWSRTIGRKPKPKGFLEIQF